MNIAKKPLKTYERIDHDQQQMYEMTIVGSYFQR